MLVQHGLVQLVGRQTGAASAQASLGYIGVKHGGYTSAAQLPPPTAGRGRCPQRVSTVRAPIRTVQSGGIQQVDQVARVDVVARNQACCVRRKSAVGVEAAPVACNGGAVFCARSVWHLCHHRQTRVHEPVDTQVHTRKQTEMPTKTNSSS